MPKEREVREVLKRLHKEGWIDAGVRGDHQKLRSKGKTLIVPLSNKELKLGTWRAIAKQAGWI